MTKLYHNNELIHECGKLGFKGEQAAMEFSLKMEEVLNESPKDKIHTFLIIGNSPISLSICHFSPTQNKWIITEIDPK